MPMEYEAWLASRVPERFGVMASLAEGSRPFREVLAELPPRPSELELLIGPEGDFSERETGLALEAGFLPVTLGEIVLRVETAVLYGLSVLKYELHR